MRNRLFKIESVTENQVIVKINQKLSLLTRAQEGIPAGIVYVTIGRGYEENYVTNRIVWKDGRVDSYLNQPTPSIQFEDAIDRVYASLFRKVKKFIQYEEHIIMAINTLSSKGIDSIYLDPSYFRNENYWTLRINKYRNISLRIKSDKTNITFNQTEAIEEAKKFMKKLNIDVKDWVVEFGNSFYANPVVCARF